MNEVLINQEVSSYLRGLTWKKSYAYPDCKIAFANEYIGDLSMNVFNKCIIQESNKVVFLRPFMYNSKIAYLLKI